MNISEYLQAGEEELFPIFFEIDSSLRQNLRRVINAFRHHRVGVHHFSGVTG
ncbi:MAG: methionine gamma-lyase family protein, partial [Trichodesmium sp. St17_bin3_1_1]|nr:methionine gamma-lyase family protein [Trichodesmium sp. St17_bin3_1_1]